MVQQQQGRPPACRAISQLAGGLGTLQKKEKIKSREAGARKGMSLFRLCGVSFQRPPASAPSFLTQNWCVQIPPWVPICLRERLQTSLQPLVRLHPRCFPPEFVQIKSHPQQISPLLTPGFQTPAPLQVVALGICFLLVYFKQSLLLFALASSLGL